MKILSSIGRLNNKDLKNIGDIVFVVKELHISAADHLERNYINCFRIEIGVITEIISHPRCNEYQGEEEYCNPTNDFFTFNQLIEHTKMSAQRFSVNRIINIDPSEKNTQKKGWVLKKCRGYEDHENPENCFYSYEEAQEKVNELIKEAESRREMVLERVAKRRTGEQQ